VSAPADRRFHRADPSRDRRRRVTRTIGRVVRWIVPALILGAALVWTGRWLLTADALRVRDLIVEGHVHLSSDEVETLVDGLLGENILRVDFDRYARQLEESPWIADVTLFRALPAKVRIRIVERTPIALARIGPLLYLVDATGVVIDEYTPAHRDFDLPVVDGLVAGEPTAERPLVDPARAGLAHALLAALREEPDLASRLSQVDVSNALDAMVMIDDDPAWLHLGHERFAERLRGYLDLRPTLAERFSQIDYIDLRFDDRVYLHGSGPKAAGAWLRPSGTTME
jgi:cell division septal protein FtsQ